jgi:hypothetical protein
MNGLLVVSDVCVMQCSTAIQSSSRPVEVSISSHVTYCVQVTLGCTQHVLTLGLLCLQLAYMRVAALSLQQPLSLPLLLRAYLCIEQ